MSKLIIWGGATSRTLRAHWMCHELGLDYEPKLIGSRDFDLTRWAQGTKDANALDRRFGADERKLLLGRKLPGL